jgi:undecaprenyl phosphate-alpha-L-ara4FN deformylase
MRIGLKVDVDTLEGYLEGVPSLVRQMENADVKATFFFSVGPDRSGVAVRRFFTQRGFVSKMLRTRPLNKLSPRNMLYGTLLRAPLIVAADPMVVRAVYEAGHEVGVHAWDHIGWHDGVGRMSAAAVRAQLSQAYDQLGEVIGQPVTSFAAPGWQCSVESLRYHDERGLLYASDTRGAGGAFRPQIGDERYRTPQLPTNLPTLDEMWGFTARSQSEVAQQWLAQLEPEVNVLTIHTEMEGMALPGLLPEFVARANERAAQFAPLRELVTGADLPVREVRPGRLPGRAGRIWVSRGGRSHA